MRILLVSVMFLFMLGTAFAAGDITIKTEDVAPTYLNTKTLTNMLNVTLNTTSGQGNITAVNVTLVGNLGFVNVSSVAIVNSTGSVVASNNTNLTETTYRILIPAGFNATTISANTSFVIAINASNSAAFGDNVSVSIDSLDSFGIDSGTLSFGVTANSTGSLVHDLHANVTIYPNFVDTNVMNQTLIYKLTPTGTSGIKNVTIIIPSTYTFVNVSTVTIGTANDSGLWSYSTASNYVNLSVNTPTTSPIMIYFNVNTSRTRINSTRFSAFIDGGNLTNVTTDIISPGVNVTTQQLMFVTQVKTAKAVALANGTDYWEFNFTFNFTANVTGLIQFKMSNWTDASSPPNSILLNTTNISYASMRNNSNFSNTDGQVNITENYRRHFGNKLSVGDTGLTTLILRMVVPSGTAMSRTWAATYGVLFRAYY